MFAMRAAGLETGHDHVALVGEGIDAVELGEAAHQTVDGGAVVDQVGRERVNAEDPDGDPALGDLVDDRVHTVLREAILTVGLAGDEAARLVMNGDVGVSVGSRAGACVISVASVPVLDVEREVAHPAHCKPMRTRE